MVLTSLEAPDAHRMLLRQYMSRKVVMLADKNEPSFPNGEGGTGFYVTAPSGKTYIMTNRHVCQTTSAGSLWASAGDQGEKQIQILVVSDESDLCLLETPTDESGLSFAPGVSAGQQIYYAGHPDLNPFTFTMGEAVGITQETVGIGVIGKDIQLADCQTMKDSFISRVSQYEEIFENYPFLRESPIFPKTKTVDLCFEKDDALITTLQIYSGASGGPVTDFLGRLVGVAYATGPTNWAYAVPLSAVRKILKGR